MLPTLRLYVLPFLLFLSDALHAQVQVNPPRQVTHQVFVNRIRTLNTDGAAATVFGNASQEADIITKVNQIWAQAGVEIIFSDVVDWTDNFAYDNNGQNGSTIRPQSHLNIIKNDSDAPTVSSTDVDMFFVEICPGFPRLTLNSSAGLASLDRPGTTVYVGSNLLDFPDGRTAIAAVMAHEIGHNLGLDHTENAMGEEVPGLPNLMSPQGITEQITDVQRTTVFTNNSGTDGFDLLFEVPSSSNLDDFLDDNNLSQGAEGDDDGDGLSNLLEFALGTDPNAPSTLPPLVKSGSNFTWSIPKQAAANDDGITYQIMVSDDLRNFDPVGTAGSGSTILNNTSSLLRTRLNGPGPFFVSVKVTVPSS